MNSLRIFAKAINMLLMAAVLTTALVAAQPVLAVTSSNWSGYVAIDGEFTGIGGSWIVPEINAGESRAADAAWVGIGGAATDDLIQVGTHAMADDDGEIYYRAWYETLPDPAIWIPLEISSGDSVTAEVQEIGEDEWYIEFANNTTGESFEKTVAYESSYSSAEWIQEMPVDAMTNAFIPLADFGKITFTEGWAIRGGERVSLADADPVRMTMRNADGDPLAVPSRIDADASSFTVSRTDAEPVPAPSYEEDDDIYVIPSEEIWRIIRIVVPR